MITIILNIHLIISITCFLFTIYTSLSISNYIKKHYGLGALEKILPKYNIYQRIYNIVRYAIGSLIP